MLIFYKYTKKITTLDNTGIGASVWKIFNNEYKITSTKSSSWSNHRSKLWFFGLSGPYGFFI